MESIKELRKICQRPSPDISFKSKHNRFISIYLTKLLLFTPITANGVSYLRIILNLAGGVFLAIGMYWYSILAIFLFQLSHILDFSDGEVARYRKADNPGGQFLDSLPHHLLIPLIFAGITIANPNLLVFGISAILFYTFYHSLQSQKLDAVFVMMKYRLDKGESITKPGSAEKEEPKVPFYKQIVRKVIGPLHGNLILTYVIAYAAILDVLPYTLVIYGITLPILWLIYLYKEAKAGVKAYEYLLK